MCMYVYTIIKIGLYDGIIYIIVLIVLPKAWYIKNNWHFKKKIYAKFAQIPFYITKIMKFILDALKYIHFDSKILKF